MPNDGIISVPHKEVLTFEEITRLASIFATLGVKKIRLTGGEPLIRKGFMNLIESLIPTEGVEEVLLTTNGIFLPFYAEKLRKAGIKRINISLDTLNKETFKAISGSDSIDQVFEGIQEIKRVGFSPIKLNTVIMKGINDNEITGFMEFAISKGIILRFIEFMKVTPLWKEKYYFPIEKKKDICNKRFKLKKIGNLDSGPAEYYQFDKKARVGFINTYEGNCSSCNRLRLTSTGELKVCLYENKGVCLRELLRENLSDEAITNVIISRIGMKKTTDYRNYESAKSYMCSIGG